MAAVLLVITPISWILLHQPQNDSADASLPIGTRTDDSYVTPSTVPVDAPTTTPPKTPSVTPTAPPTGTPTTSVTPTTPPTGRPTNTPTTVPSDQPTDHPTSTSTTVPTAPGTPRPSTTPTDEPTNTPPPPPPPPPKADGEMKADELQLFSRIDAARKEKGCAPLEQDPNITQSARSDATQRSRSANDVNATGPSMSAAGGDGWSADDAYEQMMTQSKSMILNCSLTTLGVGHYKREYCSARVLGICVNTAKRDSWVADFS